jgi:autotransporter-associated beta strand protein
VLDDADPAALPRGAAWTSLSSSSAYQGRSLVGTSGSASTVRWAAHLPEAGTMNVYARWSATTDRAANATYTIDAADGRHLVTVDQRSRGGEWVALGSYSFAAGQAAIVTLSGAVDTFGGAAGAVGGAAGTLSADAVWFEPLATPDSPRDLLINVAAGRQTQGQAGRGWIGPEWSSVTKSGTGSLVLDRGNALAGPLAIDAGSLLVTDPAAVAVASQLAVAAEAMLDVSGLSGSYQVPAGQTISGNGTIAGSVVFGRGSTLSPGLNSAAPSSQAVPGVPVPEPSGVAVVVLAIAAGVARGRRAATSVRAG